MIIYEVNKEKRTVTAYFEGGMEYWIDSLLNMTLKIFGEIPEWTHNFIARALCSLNGNYAGVAKCSPEDNFDASIGKAIAKRRLLNKWGSVKRLVLADYRNKIYHVYNTLIGRISKRYW